MDSPPSSPSPFLSQTLPERIECWQETIGWQPTAPQLHQFQRLYDAILQGNRQLNLTRITQPEEFWEKHLWDSLWGIQPWLSAEPASDSSAPDEVGDRTSLRAIDIGTGGGFPGLPVAICLPKWQMTLLDATAKKIEFLTQTIADLKLANVTTWRDRAEQAGRQQRDTYDLALVRAVAGATICAEYALPLLKPGGQAVLYRGQWTEEETRSLAAALQILGGEITAVETTTTPLTHGLRHRILLHKTAPTPDRFPRMAGVPAQKPL